MKKTMKYLLASGVALSLLTLVVSCGDDDNKLPKIDGFNNSDEVAAENLVAKWTLDGNAEESISGDVGTTSNVTYADGKIGQCAVLNDGYIYNDEVTDLHSKITASLSISAWVQVRNNGGTANEHATVVAMLTGDVTETPLNVTPGAIVLETSHFAAVKDTFRVKALVGVRKANDEFGLEDNVNWWGLDNITSPNQMVKVAEGEWMHMVMVWDNTNTKLRLYVDGKLATNPDAGWETKTGAAFEEQDKLGMIIGAFQNNVGLNAATDSWAKPMKGKVDQVRVYNTLLTQAEIVSLFKLEDAGR
jgi:hypothetical protein